MLLAVGILGATVMPHVDLPALAPDAEPHRALDAEQARRVCSASKRSTSSIAMGLAGLVNAAMLIMAASTF